MRQSGAVDDLFKINFLVVMANVLIRSNTNNFVAQSIISFDDDLDNSAKYNWASYLKRSLVITKQRWKRTSSLFYTGPMIFLLVSQLLISFCLFIYMCVYYYNHLLCYLYCRFCMLTELCST